ncbi:MAG: preprotein translocase subunit SecE [Acidobacteriota bacterium]
MATKAPVMNEQDRPAPLKKQEPSAVSNFSNGLTGMWGRMTHFIDDVRAEMKKVVVPSRKEVESTTAVVIVTVFIFGLFFWICDGVFFRVVEQIMHVAGAQ